MTAVIKTPQKRRVGDGTPGPGRTKGVQNRLSVAAKEAFQLAFDDMGGPAALAIWGKSNKTEFYKLFSKLIPHYVEATMDFGDVSDKPLTDEEWASQSPTQ